MKKIINQRIATFREWLKQEKLAAFIIPSTDPHLSEYVAPHWGVREWISGFNGSAGTVVITANKAGLWTDSRYFLQAEEQLHGTGITLYKEMLPDTPSIIDFLSEQTEAGSSIGVDGKVFAATEIVQMQAALSKKGLTLQTELDPANELWTDRPVIPEQPAFVYELKYAGKSCREKVESIRQTLTQKGCEGILLSALDEIAWTLNLRGSDVKCNPVVISYLLITPKDVVFFIDSHKLTNEVRLYLQEQQVRTEEYTQTEHFLSALRLPNILLDPNKTNFNILNSINPACQIIRAVSPVAMLKAIRNKQEIEGVRNAMKKDGVALVRFLKWLEEAVHTEQETELSIDKKLHRFRAEQALYMGESFDTIAGYKEHGAIVHYSATPESNATLKPNGFLLLDSGAQYLDGTTDITRTIALGELTEDEKTDYTLVLKGHIALATAKFPTGTRGVQLDVLAHMPMWKHGMNYLHGTGHGVGHFLSVHEGPQSIRMNENPVVLQPGMVTSNEPGIYKAGSHGIRTENLTLTVEAGEGMFGHFLKFETLTLCPICKKGIIKELLAPEEINWLNTYHQQVYNTLSDSLSQAEKDWLKTATAPI